MNSLRKKGSMSIEGMVMVGVTIVVFLFAMFAYSYFVNTFTNAKNIASVKGAQSQSTLETTKIGGLDFGGAILLDNNVAMSTGITNLVAAGMWQVSNTGTGAFTATTIGSGSLLNKQFYLLYQNSDWSGKSSKDQALISLKSDASRGDIFSNSDGTDRVAAVDIPQSTTYILVPTGATLSSTSGIKKVTTLSPITLDTATFDVYKISGQ